MKHLYVQGMVTGKEWKRACEVPEITSIDFPGKDSNDVTCLKCRAKLNQLLIAEKFP